jgi:hypothetical protein
MAITLLNFRKFVNMKNWKFVDDRIKNEISKRLKDLRTDYFGKTLEEMGEEFGDYYGIDPVAHSTVQGWESSPSWAYMEWLNKKKKVRWMYMIKGEKPILES